MIPEAQKRHCRWMLYAGQCLTIGLIPVAVISTSINATYADKGSAPILWPIFAAGAAGLVGLLVVGIGMLWKYNRRQSYDPNREDVEARIRYGQSRATLLSEPEAQDVLGRPVGRRPSGSTDDRGGLEGCILGVVCVAVLVGCGGFFGVRSIIRAHVAARLEKDLQAYIALLPASPPKGVEQPLQLQPSPVTGKVKGKMVVVNVNERKFDDLHFALPDDLRASKPEDVATVVLLTWEKRPTSTEPSSLPSYRGRYIMIGQVKVFDWERKSEIASRTFLGDVPDFSGKEPATGPKPEAQVLKFLTDLPRE
jgi:hypothetical protein